MAKTIEFNYKGTDYTLEITRKTVERLERSDFVVEDIEKKPFTTIPILFYSTFWANHPTVKREKADEIYKSLKGKEGLIAALAEMYNDTLNTLVDEPEEGDEGNAEWKKSW